MNDTGFSHDEADSILERWDQTERTMQRQIVLALAAENRLLRAVADAAERLSKRVPGSTMGELDAALARYREHREGQA